MLAGSAIHSLDFLETWRILKMRTLPYLEEKTCEKSEELRKTPSCAAATRRIVGQLSCTCARRLRGGSGRTWP